MPPRRSQYSRPCASMSFAPLPIRGWNGVRAYVPRRNAFSRSSTAAGDSSCSNKAGSSFFSDGDPPHARSERVQRGEQLRTHAAGDDFAVEELLRLGRSELAHHVAAAVEQAGTAG